MLFGRYLNEIRISKIHHDLNYTDIQIVDLMAERRFQDHRTSFPQHSDWESAVEDEQEIDNISVLLDSIGDEHLFHILLDTDRETLQYQGRKRPVGPQAISHLVRIDIRFAFVIGFQLSNKRIKVFWIVLGNIKFDALGIKGKNLCEGRINLLTEGFCIINHLLKHEFKVVGETQLEEGKQRGIRDFGKPAKIAEFFAEMQQKNQKGIRRDGKDFLQDKSRKKTGKGIIPISAKMLVKSIVKGLWNKERNIKMLFQKLKKGRDIIHKHVLAVRKSVFK